MPRLCSHRPDCIKRPSSHSKILVEERQTHSGTSTSFFFNRDLELSTISKYMKDTSERFFSIAINHPKPLISSAASYKAPPANHFIRRPRNVFTDPTTTKVEKLNNALKALEELE
ncbi:hypothetical protein EVAR_11880_1 [Eumeta japonica]|uniref:Uncharacterized protein n=1 Tax=Eumeta variegata TaxID=151549 RepID=A0A4C1U8V3_EUMVA|nr:hypothetical protein EVAR_11880_1 [Eumeta japonica]